MISLSYTTLSMLHDDSHNWVNRLLGIPRAEYPWFAEGHRLHRIVQDHVSGAKADERLADFSDQFPLVERENFDRRMKFTIPWSDKYEIFGYLDGRNAETKTILEIKSYTMWSLSKFIDSMQRRIYGMAYPDHGFVLFTCGKDIAPYKTYGVDRIGKEDVKKATEWINESIAVLESGEFTGGLDESNRCAQRYCLHGDLCHFR